MQLDSNSTLTILKSNLSSKDFLTLSHSFSRILGY